MTVAFGAQAATKHTTPVITSTIFDVESNPGSLSFAQFNASLGTLTSVQFELFNTIYGTIDIKNKASSGSTFTIHTGGDLTATVAGQTVTTGNWIDPSFTLAAGASQHTDVAAVTNSKVLTFNLPTNLSAFIGGGTYSATLDGVSAQALTSGGNAKYGTDILMDGYAKVTYTYETAPVPEPETYAMLLAGLGLMGVVARRRKSA
ncbi:PEP-CTERM sorting domain-containing protein [Duganella sp. BJB475]|nr:PEP-CTERM sorting domain-containing protein [Duganella sp. BJB475]RFP36604.1 PEP-CTERM sorting domain-containing protein [Duganella sp. BJB476]